MKQFLKIMDIATYCILVVFAIMFALIGVSALFLLIVEGDLMNIYGLAGFAIAWLIWNMLR